MVPGARVLDGWRTRDRSGRRSAGAGGLGRGRPAPSPPCRRRADKPAASARCRRRRGGHGAPARVAEPAGREPPHPPPPHRGRARGAAGCGGRDALPARLAPRLRAPRAQRLARRQPVHGRRDGHQGPPARRRRVRERPAPRPVRAEERGRRARHPPGRVEPAPDLPRRHPLDVPAQCRVRGRRWAASSHGCVQRRLRALHPVEDD